MISISDLLNLSKNIIALQDRLKRVKLRIKNHLVDDLDYFTFPKKIMLSNLLNKTDEEIINENIHFCYFPLGTGRALYSL